MVTLQPAGVSSCVSGCEGNTLSAFVNGGIFKTTQMHEWEGAQQIVKKMQRAFGACTLNFSLLGVLTADKEKY